MAYFISMFLLFVIIKLFFFQVIIIKLTIIYKKIIFFVFLTVCFFKVTLFFRYFVFFFGILGNNLGILDMKKVTKKHIYIEEIILYCLYYILYLYFLEIY